MNEGEISGGQSQEENKVFFSSSDLGASASARSMFGESTATMSTAQPTEAINTVNTGAKAPKKSILGGRSRSDAIKSSAAQAHPFVPNPNAPDFFNEAMAAQATQEVPHKSGILANKKNLIIAAIAVVAVLAIVVVAVSFVSSRTTNEEMSTAYNRFANYVLFGKSTMTMTGAYSVRERYQIVVMASNSGESKEYFEKLEKYADDLLQKTKNSILESELKTNLTDYAMTVKAWRRFAELDGFIESTRDSFINDKSKAKSDISSNYSEIIGSKNEAISNSGKKMKEILETNYDIANKLSGEECNLADLNEECRELTEQLVEDAGIMEITSQYRDDISNALGTELQKHLQNSWEYSKKIGEQK